MLEILYHINTQSIVLITDQSVLIQSEIVHLFSKDVAPTAIDLSTANIGDNKVLLEFTDTGTLYNSKVVSSSKALELSANISLATTSALDSYKSAVVSIKDIKAEEYNISVAKLQNDLDVVTKRREILSEELVYEGSLASKDKLLEKANLDSEILYLTSLKDKISLETDLSILTKINSAALDVSNVDNDNDKAMLAAQTETLKALQLLINTINELKGDSNK